MALDNAQFISELSITDPPGTDPLSEGDDQIRTSKRTQQQSFPLIDAVVNKTSAELNDVAQRSGGNVFTGNQQFNTQMRISDGTEALPALAFTQAVNMGIYRVSGNIFGIATSGIQALAIDTTKFAPFPPIRHQQDGGATFPVFSFQSSSNTGLFLKAVNQLGFATAGIERMAIEGSTIVTPNGTTYQCIGNQVVRKFQTTSVAGWNWQDASAVNRWQIQILTDGNNNNFGFRRLNSGGVSQGDMLILKQDGNVNMPQLPLGNAGLATGDLFRSVTAPGFIEIA